MLDSGGLCVLREGREGDAQGWALRGPSGRCARHPSEHSRSGGGKRSVGGSTWVETFRPPSFLLVVEIAHGLPERLLISKSNLDWLGRGAGGGGSGSPWGKSRREAGRVAAETGASEVLGELETDPRGCERRGGERSTSFLVGPVLLLLHEEATAEGCGFSLEPH